MQANTTHPAVSGDTVCADFGVRLVAYLIDGIILLIPNIIVRLLAGPVVGALAGLVIGLAYYLYFMTSTGQTPGKMVMGLKVVSAETGDVLDIGGAALRYLGYIISSIPLGLGFLWVIWDPMHEGWHDKIAKTKVIRVPSGAAGTMP